MRPTLATLLAATLLIPTLAGCEGGLDLDGTTSTVPAPEPRPDLGEWQIIAIDGATVVCARDEERRTVVMPDAVTASLLNIGIRCPG